MMLGGVSVRHLSPNPEVGWLQTPSRSSVNVINSIVQWCEACLAVVVVVVVVVVAVVVAIAALPLSTPLLYYTMSIINFTVKLKFLFCLITHL
jgi:hypothetical protein